MPMEPPNLPGSAIEDSPLDRSLSLLLAGERDAALRWSSAVVEQEDAAPSALILTCRLLAEAGRTEAAVEGFELAIRRAIDAGNLPLAVAASADLRALGIDIGRHLDSIASAFCAGSDRLTDEPPPPPPLPTFEKFQPLSSFLTGPALLSKATQIIHEASKNYEDSAVALALAPLPLFSALDKPALRALISAFEMTTVPAGQAVIRQGEEGGEAYIVARGELEVQRVSDDEPASRPMPPPLPVTLARLTTGALFGEMALLSRAPRAASVVACRPSILLSAKRETLEGVAEAQPSVGVELAAHCRRRMVANLVRTSPVLLNVDSAARPALVDSFETRVFEKNERLISEGSESVGLHLIASGEVAIIGHESGEPFVISTLGVGEVVGEVALVLRRKANADVVAVHPTVSLHLPAAKFMDLIREHPEILLGLYTMAVQRDEETASALATSTVSVTDDYVLL